MWLLKKYRILLVVFCLLWIQNNLLANKQTIEFKHLSVDEGLSEAFVTALDQDTLGFIWIGTYDGLNRYDGQKFKIYRNIQGDTNSLPGNLIDVVFHDAKQRLWLGTSHGLCYYNPKLDNFTRISCFKQFKDFGVKAIDEDKDGRIWIGTTLYGIFRLSIDHQSFERYNFNETNSFSGNDIMDAMIDSKNNVWIATKQKGLYVIDIDKGTTTHFLHNADNPNSLPDDYVSDIVEDLDNEIWISTENGLACFDANKQQFKIIKHIEGASNTLPSNSLGGLMVDKMGVLWVCTHDGLCEYDKKTKKFSVYQHNSQNSSSIANNNIQNIYQDFDGNLWVSVLGKGIDFYSPLNNRFNHFKATSDMNLPKIENSVLGIYQDRKERVWIMTDGGGLYGYDADTKSYFLNDWNSYNDKIALSKVIFSCTEDSKGNYWLSTFMSGVYKVNEKAKTMRQYQYNSNDPWSLSFDDVRYVFEDKDQKLWILTNGGGINLYDEKRDGFKHIFERDGLVSNNCLCAIQDKDDNIWIGSYNGLSIFSTKTQTFHNLTASEGSNPRLIYNWVYCLLDDSKGNVWIGTANGLNIYNKKSGEFKTITTAQGLSSNVINAIVEDEENNFWLSTNLGVSKINGSTFRVINYSKHDGLQSNQFNHGSFFKGKNGSVYFGGINGFNVFNPLQIVDDAKESIVTLTDLLINYQTVAVGASDSILKNHISQTKSITLNYKQSIITLEYITPSYTSTNIQYACLLEGFDKDWNMVGAEQKMTYMNLPAGEYCFNVKAMNKQGEWSKHITSINIIVLAPYYKTGWFKVGLFLIILIAVLVFYLLRIKGLRNRELLLKRLVDKRTNELQLVNEALKDRQEEVVLQNEELKQRTETIYCQNLELEGMKNSLEEKVIERTRELLEAKDKAEESDRLKLAFLANMSHEIRTPMNGIIGFACLLHDEKLPHDEKIKYLQHIDACSQNLLSLLTDIVDIAKIEANSLAIFNESFNITELVDEIFDQFKLELHKQDKEHVHYKLYNLPYELILNSDKNRLKQVLSNLLTNAIKFTNKGSIELVLKVHHNSCYITVRDTGIGISIQNLKIVFNRFRQADDHKGFSKGGTGLGLAISKGIIELLNGEIMVDSTENVGTEFIIKLPLV